MPLIVDIKVGRLAATGSTTPVFNGIVTFHGGNGMSFTKGSFHYFCWQVIRIMTTAIMSPTDRQTKRQRLRKTRNLWSENNIGM
jgi:hypothetical protein